MNIPIEPARPRFDCAKCPGYCCSYAVIPVKRSDIGRLARHFGVPFDTAAERFTKVVDGQVCLRHRRDEVYASTCMFLDPVQRRCTVYEARPWICRTYPSGPRCGYYEFLQFERDQQVDPDFIP